jgi:hypothetical protein
MSRISTAQTLIRSLNPTPLRTSNSQQLNAALENITTRAFANPSAITPGSREGQALDGMIGSLECLKAGKAMADVRHVSPTPSHIASYVLPYHELSMYQCNE